MYCQLFLGGKLSIKQVAEKLAELPVISSVSPKPDARSSDKVKYDGGQHCSRIPAILFADILVHAEPLIHVNAFGPRKGTGIAGL